MVTRDTISGVAPVNTDDLLRSYLRPIRPFIRLAVWLSPATLGAGETMRMMLPVGASMPIWWSGVILFFAFAVALDKLWETASRKVYPWTDGSLQPIPGVLDRLPPPAPPPNPPSGDLPRSHSEDG
jgi:hypothetical protein